MLGEGDRVAERLRACVLGLGAAVGIVGPPARGDIVDPGRGLVHRRLGRRQGGPDGRRQRSGNGDQLEQTVGHQTGHHPLRRPLADVEQRGQVGHGAAGAHPGHDPPLVGGHDRRAAQAAHQPGGHRRIVHDGHDRGPRGGENLGRAERVEQRDHVAPDLFGRHRLDGERAGREGQRLGHGLGRRRPRGRGGDAVVGAPERDLTGAGRQRQTGRRLRQGEAQHLPNADALDGSLHGHVLLGPRARRAPRGASSPLIGRSSPGLEC